jgi:signal transduction histidine kinase
MRLENRLLVYFTGGVIAVIAGVMAVVVTGPAKILREQATQRAIALGKSIASTSVSSLMINDWVELGQNCRRFATGEDVAGAVIFDRKGRVIVDTVESNRAGDTDPSIVASFPVDTRASIVSLPEGEVVEVLEPVYIDTTRSDDSRLGVVRVRLSLAAIDSQVRGLQLRILGIGGLAVLVAILSAKIFARRITQPVQRLVEATIRVVDGDLETKSGIESKDEIGELARNFDHMTAEVRRDRERIVELNRGLEAQVRERTRDLVQANESLATTNASLETTLVDLRKAQSQLVQSEKMASLGQLVAGVVHEINNPLNFIYNGIPPLAEMIDELRADATAAPVPPDATNRLKETFEEVDVLLGALREGAKRATSIVKDLRSFSRLDESERKVGDVREGIETTVNLLAHRLRNRVEVITDFAAIPPFEFYPALMNQVLMNLLSNAEQAIEGRGEIRIRTRLEDGWVAIAVEDTGKGIPPEIRARIFEPFFSTKDVGKGMGLGLSITYSIVEKHGGKIDVQSEVGRGTCFTVRLPFVNPQTTDSRAAESVPPPAPLVS